MPGALVTDSPAPDEVVGNVNKPDSKETSVADLPSELFLQCAEKLIPDAASIVRLSSVCKKWRRIVMDDAILWQKLCFAYYVDALERVKVRERLKEREDAAETSTTTMSMQKACQWHNGRQARWGKVIYELFYTSRKPFLDIYIEQRSIFERLSTFVETRAPKTYESFNPGMMVDKTTISALVAGMPEKTAVDWRAFMVFYTWVDGQRQQSIPEHGLFGTQWYYPKGTSGGGHLNSLSLLPSADLRVHNWIRGIRVLEFGSFAAMPELFIVVDAPPKYRHLLHHVISIDYDGDMARFSGRFFSYGRFTEFIANYVSDLEAGKYSTADGVISRHPEYGRCTDTSESHGIRVHISSFNFFDGSLDLSSHPFRLRITYTSACPYKTVQLKSRYWTFFHGSGFSETNKGNEIMGNPIMSAENPVWEAWSQSKALVYKAKDRPKKNCPRPYSTRFSDPVQRVGGKLTFVPGTVKKPLKGEGEFEINVKWWHDFPMILDDDHDAEDLERWKVELTGANDPDV